MQPVEDKSFGICPLRRILLRHFGPWGEGILRNALNVVKNLPDLFFFAVLETALGACITSAGEATIATKTSEINKDAWAHPSLSAFATPTTLATGSLAGQ
jgi:hypothetical protein